MFFSLKQNLTIATVSLLLASVLSSPGRSAPSTLQFYPQNKSAIGQKITASPPSKIRRYCRRLFGIYDKDADGILQESEWKTMKGSPSVIDADRDGNLTTREFERYVFDFGKNRSIRLVDPEEEEILDSDPSTSDANPPNRTVLESEGTEIKNTSGRTKRRTDTKYHIDDSRLPANLPTWFIAKDKNGDGQISLSEYAPGGRDADIRKFRDLDSNNDGVITAREVSRTSRKKKDGS